MLENATICIVNSSDSCIVASGIKCTVVTIVIVGHNVLSLYCAFKSFFYLEYNKNLYIMKSGIYVKLISKSMSQSAAQMCLFWHKVLVFSIFVHILPQLC